MGLGIIGYAHDGGANWERVAKEELRGSSKSEGHDGRATVIRQKAALVV